MKKISTWDIENDLPLLILTTDTQYGLPRDLDAWVEIEHQAGGHACIQFRKRGLILPIKESVHSRVVEITDKWLDSCVGLLGGPSLSTANEYSRDLAGIGLSCEVSYKQMMEAVYPLDTSAESLRILTDHPLPDDLDDLLIFETDIQKMFGVIGRWQAYILGQNCD